MICWIQTVEEGGSVEDLVRMVGRELTSCLDEICSRNGQF
jgi:hypothetical protein